MTPNLFNSVELSTSMSIIMLSARYGTLCIRENPGCLFIATNRDAVGNLTDLQEWPGKFTFAPYIRLFL